MNYLDIREDQGTSYFIIRLCLNKEKKSSQSFPSYGFQLLFKIVLINYCLFFIPQF